MLPASRRHYNNPKTSLTIYPQLVAGYKLRMSDEHKKNDISTEGESRELKRGQSDSKSTQESTINDSEKQKTWGKAFKEPRINDPHPSEVKGLPAVQSSFGIDFGDGRILTAKGPTQDKKNSNWFGDIGGAVKEGAKALFCPDKGHEDSKMQYLHDFNAFYTTNLSRFGIDPFIIAGLTRNEIEHRKSMIDDSQEEQVRRFGNVVLGDGDKTSIGNQQMQTRHIRRLVEAKGSDGQFLYPQLAELRKDPLRKALDPKFGAVVLGAYLQDVASRLEKGTDPVPWYDGAHKEEVKETMKKLWSSGDPAKRTDALIRSYNAGAGQIHVNNVRRHMKIINEGAGKLFL